MIRTTLSLAAAAVGVTAAIAQSDPVAQRKALMKANGQNAGAVNRMVRGEDPFDVAKVNAAFILPNLKTHLDFMEAELAKAPWFAGDTFSAADIQMSFPIEAAAARAGLDHRRPRLMDWLHRIHARPAYQAAVAKGGPFELLG